MKLNLAIATVALSLLGAVSAQAQLTLVVTPNGDTPTFGGDQVFSGLITNTGTTTFNLDGSSLTSNVTGFDIQADLLTTELTPLTLNPGDSKRLDLFELVTGGTTNYSYDYTLSEGGRVVAEASFNGTTAVPEPGSLALLASGLVGGSLFMARRRRK